jgi:hypothetical protein
MLEHKSKTKVAQILSDIDRRYAFEPFVMFPDLQTPTVLQDIDRTSIPGSSAIQRRQKLQAVDRE